MYYVHLRSKGVIIYHGQYEGELTGPPPPVCALLPDGTVLFAAGLKELLETEPCSVFDVRIFVFDSKDHAFGSVFPRAGQLYRYWEVSILWMVTPERA